jgi:hypothetical protein
MRPGRLEEARRGATDAVDRVALGHHPEGLDL